MQVSDGFWLTFREETYAYSKHPRILWIKNLLTEICLFNTQEYRVFTQVASIYINLLEQKTRLHKKRVQLPQDWFGHQHGGRFIVLGHQYGRRDVM